MSGPPGAMGPTGDWEQLYATSDIAMLPWYTTVLDPDIERALQEHDLRGRRILDLGTGPATQAMNLAKRGFDVLATDISPSAIKKAKASAKSAVKRTTTGTGWRTQPRGGRSRRTVARLCRGSA